MPALCDLPSEVLLLIFENLEGFEFTRLERTNKCIRQIVRRHQKRLWHGKRLRGRPRDRDIPGGGIQAHIDGKQPASAMDGELWIHNPYNARVTDERIVEYDKRSFMQVLKVAPTIYRHDVQLRVIDPVSTASVYRCLFDLLTDRLHSLRSLTVAFHRCNEDGFVEPFQAEDLLGDSEKNAEPFVSSLECLSLQGFAIKWDYILSHPRLQCGLPALRKVELNEVPYKELQPPSTIQSFLRSVSGTLEDLTLSIDAYPRRNDKKEARAIEEDEPLVLPHLQKLSLEMPSLTGNPIARAMPLRFSCPNLRSLKLNNIQPSDIPQYLHEKVERLHVVVKPEDEGMLSLARHDKLSELLGRCSGLRDIQIDDTFTKGCKFTVTVLDVLAKAVQIPIETVHISKAVRDVMISLLNLVKTRSAACSAGPEPDSSDTWSNGSDRPSPRKKQRTAFVPTTMKEVRIDNKRGGYRQLSDDLQWLEKHVSVCVSK